MSETFIADMRHFMEQDPGKELPGPAVRIRRFLGRIIEASTVATPGLLTQTGSRCRRRPGHKPCSGSLQVMLTELPAQIRWLCPSCGDNGIITHWRGTPWDMSPGAVPAATGDPLADLLLTGMEHRALQQIEILDQQTRDVVNQARETSAGVLVRGTEEQMEDLAGFLAAEVNHEKRRSRRNMLQAILGRLQADGQPLEFR